MIQVCVCVCVYMCVKRRELEQNIRDLLRDLDKLLEIVRSRLLINKHGEIDRGKIAHGNLVWCSVLDDLSAKI